VSASIAATNGDSVKSRPKAALPLPCGKLGFRRNPASFIPSLGWKAEPSSREKGVSPRHRPSERRSLSLEFLHSPWDFQALRNLPSPQGMSMSHIFLDTGGASATDAKRSQWGGSAARAVQISTGLWGSEVCSACLAGPNGDLENRFGRWEGCCRRLSPLPWERVARVASRVRGTLGFASNCHRARSDPPVPRPDEVHRDRGTPSPQGEGLEFLHFMRGGLGEGAVGEWEPRDWGFRVVDHFWRSRVTRSRQKAVGLLRHRAEA